MKYLLLLGLLLRGISAYAFHFEMTIHRNAPALLRQDSTMNYSLDLKKSEILWKGKSVRGPHMGNLSFSLGSVSERMGVIFRGHFEMDMNTIFCTDLEGKEKKDLEDHLKNEDFFEVDKYPKSFFSITDVRQEKGADTIFTLVGDLTIKGITKEVIVPIGISKSDDRLVITSEQFAIDRDRWDISYFGITNMLIEDDIYLELHLEFFPEY